VSEKMLRLVTALQIVSGKLTISAIFARIGRTGPVLALHSVVQAFERLILEKELGKCTTDLRSSLRSSVLVLRSRLHSELPFPPFS
jgi:hypothetical protein